MDSQPLVCADCGSSFEFNDDERSRFAARGFAQPKRCKSCRAAKRRRQQGRPAPSRGPSDGTAPLAMMRTDAQPPRRQRPRAAMRPATCTICGASTEVPFEPDGVRPVYCLPCLKQRTR